MMPPPRPGRTTKPPAVDDVLRAPRPRGGAGAGRVIGQLVGTSAVPASLGSEVQLVTLALDDVAPSPDNPRRAFDEQALAELADSIKAHGVLEPVLVRPVPAPHDPAKDEPGPWDGPFVLVAGERRWRAARLAGLTHLPAIVKDGLSDDEALKLALIENLQRRDLDPIEEAEGYAKLQGLGVKQAAIAAAIGRSQPRVANRLRLLDLPEDIRARISGGALSVRHGERLATLRGFPALQSHLGRLAAEGGYTSEQLEKGAQQGGLLGQYGVQDELQKAGVVRVLSHHEAFDVGATCRAPGACPFGAYRATAYGAGLCLKPEHYRELAAAAARAQAEEASAVVAEAKAAGTPVPRLDELPYDSIQRLYHGVELPDGCSEACPCRVVGLTARGEAVPVCADPDRFQRLKRAHDRAQQDARRLAVQGRLDDLLVRLELLPAVTGRDLALLAIETLYRSAPGRESALREALEAGARRWCPEHAEALLAAAPWEWDGWQRAEALAGIEPLALVRVVLWVTLSLELQARVRYDHGRPGRAEWYLRQERQPAGETAP